MSKIVGYNTMFSKSMSLAPRKPSSGLSLVQQTHEENDEIDKIGRNLSPGLNHFKI
jgi:hypothetical protein